MTSGDTTIIILYFASLLCFIIFSVAGVYHLWRFGYSGDLSKPAIIIYTLASAAVVLFSLFLISIRIF